jgi:ABC-type bacteriocin/lantibiotic exporter with double-glycine peptidase domain
MIELKNVSFEYENRIVFENLNLLVSKGEKIGIVGESGCGKSTLLKLIAGLYKPSSGTLTVDGETEPELISRKVSVVMQTSMLLPLTIYENITMGHKYPLERVEEVCRMANLSDWVATLPEGLDTYLGDRADGLSGGQAQRISIARALCKEADILLMDEPTSALDRENAESILEALERSTKGKTVVHVTHRPEHLRGYDRVYRMEAGVLRSFADAQDDK